MTFFMRFLRRLGIDFKLSYVGKNQFKYRLDGGDDRLRYDYKLRDGAVIFDLGAYEGTFISNIYKEGYNIHAFEINSEKLIFLQKKFTDLAKINGFGLGEQKIKGINANNGPGNYLTETVDGDVLIEKFDEYCFENNINEIDLIKINIEGSEYRLIKYLDSIGFIEKINFIQIQPHDFVENSLDELLGMHRILSKTHELYRSYPFVWDFWRRRSE